MASHRKPRQRPLSGGTVRTAATLALAGAATATAFEGTSHADPQPTPAQVKAEVDRLYGDAEAATERHNGAKVKADEAERALTGLRDEAARKEERLNTARRSLGAVAATQYRSGGLGPALQLAMATDPQDYLERASLLTRAGDRTAADVASVRRGLDEVGQLREKAAGQLADLRARRDELAGQKAAIEGGLATAQRLLARLTAEERAAYEARSGAAPPYLRASPAPGPPPRRPPPTAPAPRGRWPSRTRRSASRTCGARPDRAPTTARA